MYSRDKEIKKFCDQSNTVELHLSVLCWLANDPDRPTQKSEELKFSVKICLIWQIKLRLLKFTVITCVKMFRQRHVYSSRSHATVLNWIR